MAAGENVESKTGYFAAPDAERAADFNRMIHDPDVEAIWCSRGGYGAARILDLIDWASLEKRPKRIIGYSDITALLLAAFTKSKIVSFHGPMPNRDLRDSIDELTLNCLDAVLYGKPPYDFPFDGEKTRVVREGAGTGMLIGGCLSIINSLIGTQYFPNFSGAILFFEDVAEPPYRIDRMLTQLKSIGALDNLAGVLIGDLSGTGDSDYALDVVRDIFRDSACPVICGLPIGHASPTWTFPIGGMCRIETSPCAVTWIKQAFDSG